MREMHEAVDEANDQLVLNRVDVRKENCINDSPQMTPEQKAIVEIEKAEIMIANPESDPDWVDMRRRMRGSFSSLNVARCDVSNELLDHIMTELCVYWKKLPCVDHKIDPFLERNIMREIHNFRFKMFGLPAEEYPANPEPERCPPPPPCPEKVSECPAPLPCANPDDSDDYCGRV